MTAAAAPRPGLEFIATCGALAALGALGIDALLPGLPAIAGELSPDAPNRAQGVITAFMLGMGLGMLTGGLLADRFGRRGIILAGCLLYALAALAGWGATGLGGIVPARVVQGIGASWASVATTAMIRDLFAGPAMARIMSFSMMIFALVPAVAPMLGQAVIAGAGWRAVFALFGAGGLILAALVALRRPETLARDRRRPISLAALRDAAAEILAHPQVRLAVAAQVLGMATLFSALTSVQPIFDRAFGRAESFPFWFAVVALAVFLSSFANGSLVMARGIVAMLRATYAAQVLIGFVALGLTLLAPLPPGAAFAVFMVWLTGQFLTTGLTLGNLNALALEPLGHLAGTAASVISAAAMIGGSVIAALVGMAFDGTPRPLMTAGLAMMVLALALSRRMAAR